MTNTNEKTVTISVEEYEYLTEEAEILSALRAMGVDNWEGWDEAMSLLGQDEDEDEDEDEEEDEDEDEEEDEEEDEGE